MRYKSSYYNHLAHLQSGQQILFNFLTGKWLEIPQEQVEPLRDLLENCNVPYGGKMAEMKSTLLKELYLVPEDANELEIVRINNLSSRYDSLVYNLVLMPTLACNFACPYCYENHADIQMSSGVKSGIISWGSQIARIAKRFVINWFGGEPLLSFPLIEEVNRALIKVCTENRCFFVSDITTNGYLLTDEMISKVDELRIASFQITLDGPPEVHNRYRPLKSGEGTFDIVFANILKLLDQTRARVFLRVNVDQNNLDRIPELLELIPPKYRTSRLTIVFKDIFSDPGGAAEKIVEIDQKRITNYQMIKQLYLRGMEMGFTVFLPAFSLQKHHCNSGSKNYFIVHPTGDLYRCTVEFAQGSRVGRLLEDGRLDIDSYAAARWLSYIPGDDERCAVCKFLPLCQGGCRYNRMMGKRPCALESTDLDSVIELYYLAKLQAGR